MYTYTLYILILYILRPSYLTFELELMPYFWVETVMSSLVRLRLSKLDLACILLETLILFFEGVFLRLRVVSVDWNLLVMSSSFLRSLLDGKCSWVKSVSQEVLLLICCEEIDFKIK